MVRCAASEIRVDSGIVKWRYGCEAEAGDDCHERSARSRSAGCENSQLDACPTEAGKMLRPA